MPKLIAVATRVPPIEIDVAQTKQLISKIAESSTLAKYSAMVDSSQIERRYLTSTISSMLAARQPAERNRLFLTHALPLAEEIARDLLLQTETRASDISAVICVSCTGFAIPSLDAHLVARLGINPLARRIPISQLGCSAGVAGIGIASELLKHESSGTILLLSVEMGSLLLQGQDPTDEDLVGAILFADGAGGALISAESRVSGPSILAAQSVFIENSTEILGIYLSETGFRLRLSRQLPAIVTATMRPAIECFLRQQGLDLPAIDFYAFHPGGRKVLDCMEECLDLDEADLRVSRDVMTAYGNTSSATIFFVLQQLQKSATPPQGSLVLAVAPGAGMSIELVLLRWDSPLQC